MMKKMLQFIGINLLVFSPALNFAQSPSHAPQRASLVDTGYDACLQSNGDNCESNRNLLIRGDQPLDNKNNYSYNPDQLRNLVFSYVQKFKQSYNTKASLPDSVKDLSNYRIVIINLLYDWTDHGSDAEFIELTNEFKYSHAMSPYQMPEQHKMYGLDAEFNPQQYAFAWWPITLLGKKSVADNLNWPNQDKVPVPRSDQFYKPMNFPYLITGVPYQEHWEDGVIDLPTLLKMQPADGHPLLIFYHCVAGKDRTGAVTMAYFMKHGGYANVIMPDSSSTVMMTRNPPLSYTKAFLATTSKNYPRPKEQSLVLSQVYCTTLGKQKNDCDRNF
jgi:hypothetical protein